MRHLAPLSFCYFPGQINSGDSNSDSKLKRVRYCAPLFVFKESAFAKHGLFQFFPCQRDKSIKGLERNQTSADVWSTARLLRYKIRTCRKGPFETSSIDFDFLRCSTNNTSNSSGRASATKPRPPRTSYFRGRTLLTKSARRIYCLLAKIFNRKSILSCLLKRPATLILLQKIKAQGVTNTRARLTC